MHRFIEGVESNWAVRPVAPFGLVVEIGDIGRVGPNGEWEPISTTKRRFDVVPQGIRTQPAGDETWSLTSGRDVTFKAYARGQPSDLIRNVADAEARAEIAFHSSESFAFGASRIRITSASEIGDVLQAIRRAYHERGHLPENQRWEKDLAYVFAVADAESMTALIATQANTTVAVTGAGELGPPQSAANLALGVSVGISTNELLNGTRTPAPRAFYRAYRLNPSIFRRWDRERDEVLQGIVAPAPEDVLNSLNAKPLPDFDEAFESLATPAPTPV